MMSEEALEVPHEGKTAMTTTEFWNRLDALSASKDTSNSMLEVAQGA